jgi:hypothetical protein
MSFKYMDTQKREYYRCRVDVYVGKPTYVKVRSESWSV